MSDVDTDPLHAAIDPVTLEVLRGQLDSVAAEMQLTILKSSHSSIVTESLDATSALFDTAGRTVAQAVAIPIHLGVLAELGKRFAQAFPQGVARRGDVYAVNDPYAGGTHLPDIGVAAPVFHGERLAGYVVTMTHHQDVGGSVPGSTAIKVYDHFAEGLRIPMIRLVDGGVRDEDMLRLMMANSRTPDNMRGDLNAQIAACSTGVRRYGEIFERWGVSTVERGSAALLEYAERLTRLEIEKIPDGVYEFTDYLDDDGSSPEAAPIPFHCRMTVDGSDVHFDFTGTGEQVRTAINNVPYSAISAIYYVVRTLTADSAPNNDGCYRPVSFHMPEGSIINPRFPAPINARAVSLRRVVDVVLGTMAQAIPERMTAANCGQSSLIHLGTVLENGRRVVGTIAGPWMGGMGARAGKDGIDVTDHDASNVFHLPIEVGEAELPVRINRVELWTDSGGAGRWRGGLGYFEEFEWLHGEAAVTVRRDRHKFAPWGLSGGANGPLCRTNIARAGCEPEPLASKTALELRPGDRVQLWTTGSGGHGPPVERDPWRVLEDVLDERVSLEAAERFYGVVIRDGRVDESATRRCRAAMAGRDSGEWRAV
ncbi:hydantoinase B/oxoprolinase family protein [Lentisalinibacter orientalis]|uniref:hydantoinase B/oxoprolinase family protein n=1 Tax=Lentisalinibacter orientalis TaxID=2992241 RepID=UPI0038658A25